jgi:site-specific DNA recombinase
VIELTCPATRVRRGHQLRLVIPGPEAALAVPAMRDAKLVALLAEAYAARTLVLASPERSISAIAANTGRCRTHLARLLPMACLAPDIVTAIVEGRQPPSMTARSLLATDLPLAWREQRTALGLS